jgi:glycosyltransferase involved in cell wall biosynthesis
MVVNDAFAPCLGGSPVLLANLLGSYPGEVLAAVRQHDPQMEDPGFAPPCPVERMAIPRRGLAHRVFFRLQCHAPCLWAYRRFLRRQVRFHRPSAILAASPSLGMFVSAFRVAREASIPFYAHMHDLWEENEAPGTAAGRLTRRWEEIILRQSRRVLCMTDAQAEFYREKYGISPQLLPHAVPPATLAAAPRALLPPTLSPRTVLFVGAVSDEMNSDALAVLVRSVEFLPADVQVLIISRISREGLLRSGVALGPRIAARSVSREEVARLTSSCHVLFAPLSHKNCSPCEVRTVFSTKLLEYLVSGRPILVFAPADSFHAQSARRGQWGHVVDQDDPGALAAGIVELLKDEALCSRLVAGALAEARRRDAAVYAQRLYEWVREDSGHASGML